MSLGQDVRQSAHVVLTDAVRNLGIPDASPLQIRNLLIRHPRSSVLRLSLLAIQFVL